MKTADPVVERLDRILKFLVLALTSERTQRERIELLSAIGLGATEIAEMLGTTANTVNVALHNIRKRGREKSKTEK